MGIKCPSEGEGRKRLCEREMETLSGFKRHMTRWHGGYTEEQIQAAISQLEPSGETQAEFADVSSDFPARVEGEAANREETQRQRADVSRKPRQSSQSKALNQKLNECIDLTVKHLMGTIKEEEKDELNTKRGELVMASFGAQFNFDEKIVAFESRWMLIVMLIALYLVPNLPTAKTMMNMYKEKQKKEAQKQEKVN